MPKKIIIADDNPDFAESLRLILGKAGFAVRVAATADEALGMQRAEAADIFITDLVMPEVDGFELITRLRHEFPNTRIVAISGNGKLHAPRYLSAAKLIGVDAAFHKPFDVPSLVQTLIRM